jgi:hypothetical protein
VTLKLGGWYEIVTNADQIYVGQVKGYRVNPANETVIHKIFLDGVAETGLVGIELRTVRRLREIGEIQLHINVAQAVP